MKELLSNTGIPSKVDDEDYLFLRWFKWSISKQGYFYTFCKYRMDGETRFCPHTLHSMINQTPKGKHTDHINGDPLDNQKVNLRLVSPAQNNINVIHPAKNKTGYPGIYAKIKSNGTIRYRAVIEIDGKRKSLGYFKTPEEAHAVYAKEKEKRKTELFDLKK